MFRREMGERHFGWLGLESCFLLGVTRCDTYQSAPEWAEWYGVGGMPECWGLGKINLIRTLKTTQRRLRIK
jgi:hypothetical protein